MQFNQLKLREFITLLGSADAGGLRWRRRHHLLKREDRGPGITVDIPLAHKDDIWSFDHLDTLTVSMPDAPRPEDIVVAIAIADGGWPHPRVGRGRV